MRTRISSPTTALLTVMFCLAPLVGMADGPPATGNAVQQPHPIPPPTVGKVIETMNASGYTYVHVEAGKKRIWAAAPGFEVAVGDEVEVPPGAPMRDFHSKTLGRDFPEIFFVDHIRVTSPADGSPVESDSGGHGDSQAKGSSSELDLSGIARAEGGQTVAEILEAGAALAGKPIRVRGRVTKFIPRIMGTNFFHLRDGTTAGDGGNDLTVTTQSDLEVGDRVLVQGVVTADKDFGHGYVYDLIIEDAQITKE